MPMESVRRTADLPSGPPMRDRADRPAGGSPNEFRGQLALARVGQLNERLDQALKQIDELGARLAGSQSFEDLKRYRQAVALFVHDLSNSMLQIRTEMDWDPQTWEQRSLITIRNIDEELEKLTNMVLAQEKDHFAILDKIGEIKGLLLDIRM